MITLHVTVNPLQPSLCAAALNALLFAPTARRRSACRWATVLSVTTTCLWLLSVHVEVPSALEADNLAARRLPVGSTFTKHKISAHYCLHSTLLHQPARLLKPLMSMCVVYRLCVAVRVQMGGAVCARTSVSIAALLTLQGCGHGSSSERARSAVTGALRRKLAALMADFQQLRSRIQDEYRSVYHDKASEIWFQMSPPGT
jgi:Syntaxin